MKIGIIGTGHMGRALGLRWAREGHQVLFGSRDLSKAKTFSVSRSEPWALECSQRFRSTSCQSSNHHAPIPLTPARNFLKQVLEVVPKETT